MSSSQKSLSLTFLRNTLRMLRMRRRRKHTAKHWEGLGAVSAGCLQFPASSSQPPCGEGQAALPGQELGLAEPSSPSLPSRRFDVRSPWVVGGRDTSSIPTASSSSFQLNPTVSWKIPPGRFHGSPPRRQALGHLDHAEALGCCRRASGRGAAWSDIYWGGVG